METVPLHTIKTLTLMNMFLLFKSLKCTQCKMITVISLFFSVTKSMHINKSNDTLGQKFQTTKC